MECLNCWMLSIFTSSASWCSVSNPWHFGLYIIVPAACVIREWALDGRLTTWLCFCWFRFACVILAQFYLIDRFLFYMIKVLIYYYKSFSKYKYLFHIYQYLSRSLCQQRPPWIWKRPTRWTELAPEPNSSHRLESPSTTTWFYMAWWRRHQSTWWAHWACQHRPFKSINF